MKPAPTYWYPYSPAFRLPLMMLGILGFIGFFASTHTRPMARGQVFALGEAAVFFGLSFARLRLRTYSPGAVVLRRVAVGVLVVMIAGLGWAIYGALMALPQP